MIGDDVLWFDKFIPGKAVHTRPPLRSWGSENFVDNVKLMDLVVALEDWLLRKEFQHYASRTDEN